MRKQKVNIRSKIHTFTLDEIYQATAFVFHEKNEKRTMEATFSHLVEHCSILLKHHNRKDAHQASEALIKCFSWLLPLLAKARVASVERVIFRKFPGVCYYCGESPHNAENCKDNNSLSHEERVKALQEMYLTGWDSRPRTMNGWQMFFQRIYPKDVSTISYSCIKLNEELGEMTEVIRVYDHSSTYLLSEAADLLSHFFGIANEIQDVYDQGESDNVFDLDDFVVAYPGQCKRCSSTVCICPHLPKDTIGRISREIPIIDREPLFCSNFDLTQNGRAVARKLRQSTGINRYQAD